MADDFAGLEDFGQKVDLTVRIREILRNYPEGTSIVKELVQNADDAGAQEFKLCLDERAHASRALVAEQMAGFQGLSLLAYNSAQFQEADWASIQRIGDSLKKAGSSGAKTGRFGIWGEFLVDVSFSDVRILEHGIGGIEFLYMNGLGAEFATVTQGMV